MNSCWFGVTLKKSVSISESLFVSFCITADVSCGAGVFSGGLVLFAEVLGG